MEEAFLNLIPKLASSLPEVDHEKLRWASEAIIKQNEEISELKDYVIQLEAQCEVIANELGSVVKNRNSTTFQKKFDMKSKDYERMKIKADRLAENNANLIQELNKYRSN